MTRLMALALAAMLATLPASAQTWPDKPVHVIVPFTAGSATDVVARAVAQAMSKNLGQVFVVENKPGAGGTIGAGQVAKSAPDGYTLLVNSSAHTVNPSIYPNLNYDTAKDLPAVSALADMELRYELPTDSRTRVPLNGDVEGPFSVDVTRNVGIQPFLLIDRTCRIVTAHCPRVMNSCDKNS